MDYFQAIILAILQGLTEFLPISSSAHLILLPYLMEWQQQSLAFDVAVHVGTLLAVVVYLRKELRLIIDGWLRGFASWHWSQYGNLGWFLIIATIPLGIAGLLAIDLVESHLRSPVIIALATLFFALVLWWVDRGAEDNPKELAEIGWRTALFAGVAQIFALIPGTSRSGVTMSALLAAGFSRRAAARFSFLMAIPAIVLPGGLKAYELTQATTNVPWLGLFIAVFFSAITAFLCIRLFMHWVQKVGMLPFVIYRILLAALILILVT